MTVPLRRWHPNAASDENISRGRDQPEDDPISRHSPADLPCRVRDPDLWFAETPAQLEQAKQYCADCHVRLACLAGALQRREPWGVWGGEIFHQGQIIARKRPRGRPRKDTLAA